MTVHGSVAKITAEAPGHGPICVFCVHVICIVLGSATGGHKLFPYHVSFGLALLWIERMAARATATAVAAVATSLVLGNTKKHTITITASALKALLLAP